MRIPANQFEKLSQITTLDFVSRLVQFLRNEYDEAREAPICEIEAAVQRQILRAASYGFNTERHIVFYVIAAFLLGESFDQDFPAAQTILSSWSLSADDKATWLAEWTWELFAALSTEQI